MRDEVAEAAVEIDVDELFDLVGLVGERVECGNARLPGAEDHVPERRRDAEVPVGRGVVMGQVILAEEAAERVGMRPR